MKWPVSSTVRGRTGRSGLAARRQWIAADHGALSLEMIAADWTLQFMRTGATMERRHASCRTPRMVPFVDRLFTDSLCCRTRGIALTWKHHLCVHLQSYHLRTCHPIHSEAWKRCLFRWSRLVWMSYH